MPKPQRRVQAQVAPQSNFTVRTIRALPGGKFVEEGEFNCGGDGAAARNVSNRMQSEFDDDGDPCRTYVFRTGDSVPIHAGLERSTFRGR